MSKKDKGRLPQFVPLLHATMDFTAWRELSHGAQALYVALKRRVPRDRNQGFLSFRHARTQLKASPRKIAEWFNELEHYGFIVLAQHGCLGVEGRGKSPHWRLTELGTTSRTSADGLPEAPTRDFLKWDGVVFESYRDARTPGSYGCTKQNPVTDGGYTPLPTGVTVALPTGVTPKSQSVTDGVHIESVEGVTDGVHITSITTPPDLTPASLKQPKPTDASSTDDPRIASLSKWGASAKKPWTKPTIILDEARDFAEFPMDKELAA